MSRAISMAIVVAIIAAMGLGGLYLLFARPDLSGRLYGAWPIALMIAAFLGLGWWRSRR